MAWLSRLEDQGALGGAAGQRTSVDGALVVGAVLCTGLRTRASICMVCARVVSDSVARLLQGGAAVVDGPTVSAAWLSPPHPVVWQKRARARFRNPERGALALCAWSVPRLWVMA